MVYGGVLAGSCTRAPQAVGRVALGGGGGGGLMLLFVLARGVDDLIGSSILLLGAAYVIAIYAGRHELDQGVPLVAAGLLACGELATWSLEERLPVARHDGATDRHRRPRGRRWGGTTP